MASSPNNLVKNLRNDKDYDSSKFIFTTNFFKERYPNINNEDLKLLLKKGVYPYEYMDNFNKFQDTELPPIKNFIQS